MVLTCIFCVFFKEDTSKLVFLTKRPIETNIVCSGQFEIQISPTEITVEKETYRITRKLISEIETIYVCEHKTSSEKMILRTEKKRIFITIKGKITVYE